LQKRAIGVNLFVQCYNRKKDLKQCLSELISILNINLQVEELVNYWFKNDSAIDINFINLITELKKDHKMLYLATNQEKYRKNYVYQELGLNKYFNDIFCSGELGF